MHTRDAQQGFTLIELMIVVAIIGILAALAIPQYQDYIARTQVTRVVFELSQLRSAVEDGETQGKTIVNVPNPTSSEASLGFPGSDLLTGSVSMSQLVISGGSTATPSWSGILGANAASAVKGTKITLRRTAAGSYVCEISSTALGWKNSYVPTGCTFSI
jgi:type IV pilus assembly protein PilA